jgi:hypothetical protein
MTFDVDSIAGMYRALDLQEGRSLELYPDAGFGSVIRLPLHSLVEYFDSY